MDMIWRLYILKVERQRNGPSLPSDVSPIIYRRKIRKSQFGSSPPNLTWWWMGWNASLMKIWACIAGWFVKSQFWPLMPMKGPESCSWDSGRRTPQSLDFSGRENISSAMFWSTAATVHIYLTYLPGSEVDKNIRISPFSKAPAKVMVLGVVVNNCQKCLIIFVPDGERSSPPTPTRHCFASKWCPGFLSCILREITCSIRTALSKTLPIWPIGSGLRCLGHIAGKDE